MRFKHRALYEVVLIKHTPALTNLTQHGTLKSQTAEIYEVPQMALTHSSHLTAGKLWNFGIFSQKVKTLLNKLTYN